MKKQKITTKELPFIGLFTALIIITAQISIPMPYGVPMTLQTFIIPLSGIILGKKNGPIVCLIYILMGAIGLPVFTQFKGGLGVIFGPTGGFILGFPMMSFFAGWGAEKNKVLNLAIGLLCGIVIDYSIGVVVFMLISGSSMQVALAACVIPFIVTEVIKFICLIPVGMKSRDILIKTGIQN